MKATIITYESSESIDEKVKEFFEELLDGEYTMKHETVEDAKKETKAKNSFKETKTPKPDNFVYNAVDTAIEAMYKDMQTGEVSGGFDDLIKNQIITVILKDYTPGDMDYDFETLFPDEAELLKYFGKDSYDDVSEDAWEKLTSDVDAAVEDSWNRHFNYISEKIEGVDHTHCCNDMLTKFRAADGKVYKVYWTDWEYADTGDVVTDQYGFCVEC